MSAPLLLASTPTNWWEWLADSESRDVSGAIPHNLWLTLEHALGGVALAVVIGLPLAAWLAHTRRGEVLAASIVNLGRVIPTITLLAIAVTVSLRNGFGFAPWPIVFALAAMSLPPVFANTYTAVRQVPPEPVDAARAMGLSERQILARVELPLALPLMLTGIRVAITQAIATEAVGALFGSGGLGVYVRYGTVQHDDNQVQAGAILVAGTAMAADALLYLLTRAVTPRGVRAPTARRRARAVTLSPAQPTPGGTP